MRNVATHRQIAPRLRLGRRAWVGTLGLLTLGTGCARTLTIHQEPYINTAAQAARPADKRTGEPLELTAVVVYPEDYKKPGNELLRPDSKITCKDWFERRPEVGLTESGNRFDLSRDQVFVLTNDDKVFGKRIGSALRGAVLDGDKPIRKTNITLRWNMVHNQDTVLYVFPKFVDRGGSVLPASPARFSPPGAYEADLEVKLGVHPNRALDEAQYIEILSRRKLYGSESK